MATLESIINDAGGLVDNVQSTARKIAWLNAINQEFFDVVKIPKLQLFTPLVGVSIYSLPALIRSKNIDYVRVGTAEYDSFQYGQAGGGRNYWVLDDDTNTLTLSPAPYDAAVEGVIRYFKISTVLFSESNLGVTPEAPDEYHRLYVLGLAERIAKADDDILKGNNYGAEYRNGLLIAQQNFQKRGAAPA